MISLTSPVKTPYHRLPAGLKLGLLCLVTFGLFLLENLWLHLAILLGVAGLYVVGGREFLRAGLTHLRPLLFFLVVIAAWHLATGTPADGARIALTLLNAVSFANLVTMTTRLDDLIGVVRWLLAPFARIGIRTAPLEIAIALVVRFAPVLAQNGTLLAESWRSRSPKNASWRIIAPLALLAVDDAEYVAEALRARGGVR
ncbi:MAG: energy-coupling factor transporter transmembrane protein EcfT [Halocynthiibacter sp.]